MRDEVYRPLDGSDSGSAFQGKDDEESWAVVLPVPEGRGSYCPCDRRGKKADKVWRYCDPAGRLLGLVARWDLLPDGAERKRKRILPFAWCRDALGREEWRSKHFPVPRPLYRLDRLAARNDAPVLICEGEKSADAAALIFPDYV